MEDKYRKSGIDTVDDIPWGTHMCQFYRTKDDLIDILVPYFRAGLDNNEFCIGVTSEAMGVEEAKASLYKGVGDLDHYISKGQIEILDDSQWCIEPGKFNGGEILQCWVEKERKALEKGFVGLRLTENTFWTGAEDWVAFREYEAIMDSIIGEHRMIAMCTYSLNRCTASEVLDVLNNHGHSLFKRKDSWRTVESDERKRLKKALSSSEVRFRRLFETAQDGILILDADTGQIMQANPFLEDMLGYNTEELLGKRLREIGLFRDIVKSEDAFKELQRVGHIRYEDLQLETKDGKPVDVEFISNVYDIDHAKTIQCNIRDISRRKEIEGVSKQYESQLERIVKQRTGELAASNRNLQQELIERKKMQEHLIIQDRLASIGQLASGIAHELNNPLTGVIGFSELLLEKDLPKDIKEDLEIINHEAKRTANVVKGILTFARKQKAEKEPVNINNIIKNILQLRSYEHKVGNLEVNTQLAPELPEVLGNSGQLQQVFLNLIVNAEQAMLEAHARGTFTVVTEQVGDTIKASVVDDGPGISKENMSKLFTPFFTTKDVGKGTGLGLSICHGIVNEHGGKISAESEPGKGATFVVELPINK